MDDVYFRLARHLEKLIMSYPFSDALISLLREMFSPAEARVVLAIPNNLHPLEAASIETIASNSDLPANVIAETLESLASRNLIYSANIRQGVKGYALLQIGYGMPQTFFWKGDQSDHAKKMAKMVLNYFTVPVTKTVYGGTPTKTYKYSPAGLSVDLPMQGVLPHEQIGSVVRAASKIAVAHCPCRMSAGILGRTDCHHSIEVCLKYDEMAEFVVSQGLAREISEDEALHILTNCEKEGLVHMVDNVRGEIKHTCNCCGHYCWNVGIIRRRKIPRDVLMAVYFIRETDSDECIGCGACAEICPADAVTMSDDLAEIDPDWCIGCGVCAVTCPTEAISVKRRSDKQPPETFSELHNRIRSER